MNKKWDKLTDEQRKLVTQELISFFEYERGEKIGVIAAKEIMNFMLQTLGPHLYNTGLQDAQKALQQRIEELNYDIDDLME